MPEPAQNGVHQSKIYCVYLKMFYYVVPVES